MNKEQEFDFSFRPESYWPKSLNREQLLSRIKGKARRDFARATMEVSGSGYMDPFFGSKTLSKEERRSWGSIHPSLMGGEYLPDQPLGTVEIARISLASVTSDQIVIYARKTAKNIRYSVVDEYGTHYKQPFYQRKDTIRLGEVIKIIDESEHPDGTYTGGVVFSTLSANGCQDDESLDESFVEVASAFYPDLGAYYKFAVREWYAKHQRENGDNE
jgi:hypothetical protein